METNERIEAEREEDNRADMRGILVIFCALIAAAVHFISQTTF